MPVGAGVELKVGAGVGLSVGAGIGESVAPVGTVDGIVGAFVVADNLLSIMIEILAIAMSSNWMSRPFVLVFLCEP